MPKSVRMADIAARMGVSTVTVSKALADKEGVSEEIRTKIKMLAGEMGYRPSIPVKKVPKTTGNVGILIPAEFVDKHDSFYWDLYKRVITRLTGSGYYGILEMLQHEEESRLVQPRVLQDSKIDGLILLGQAERSYREMLRSNGKIPVMFLDSYDAASGRDSVISDGYYGMYVVTSYLISLGHKKIYFVGSLNVTSSISDRYFGYCRAMLEHGIAVTPDMVIPDRSAEGLLDIRLPEKLPTAFACNCDVVACDVINRLQNLGLRVPEDISIAGFDDYVYPGLVPTALTTYAVDKDGMARTCVDSLLRKIHNPHYSPNLKIVSGHLVIRDSAKKPE